MTATVTPRTCWWDANGQVIELDGSRDGFGRWVPKHDAALASLVGGPADGRGAVMIRGKRPPAIVGKPIKGQTDLGRPLIAWYIRDDGPPRLTYRFLFSSSIYPTVKQGKL